MSTAAPPRPLTVLIAALGGEGGGVLTDWIVTAATAAGLPVQSTSIPGVAQRTGATTYYIEIFPGAAPGRDPVMAVHPCPGNVDVMIASELLEAGRAMENGMVTPERTTLIASTHRVYAIAEKSAMADGTYDAERVLAAARELAQRPILGDFAALAEGGGGPLNAVLLGLLAASGCLPIPAQGFAAAISAQGVAVERNLAAFAAGRDWHQKAPAPAVAAAAGDALPPELADALAEQLPQHVHQMAAAGLARLVDFQDAAYARRYLQRLAGVLAHDSAAQEYRLTREAARHLALWMSYEDLIRVADLKSRAERLARVRAEVRAGPGEPLRVREFFKPGVEELAAVLPPAAGAALLRFATRRGALQRWRLSLRVNTHTVLGYLLLRSLAALKRWRPRSLRFHEEQRAMDRWLDAVHRAAALDYALALEVVECANLNKGYGDTYARGRANLRRLLAELIEPLLAQGASGEAPRVRAAREAALADPESDISHHISDVRRRDTASTPHTARSIESEI